MLQIEVKGTMLYDEATNKVVTVKGQTLQLEHSLVSISKWESKWHKPFLNNNDMTPEMNIDYVRCMTLTQHVNPDIYNYLTVEDMQKIREYIDDPMTATWFRNMNKRPTRDVITNEIVYYWMDTFGIPYDPCQKWHFNRLMTLIRVHDEKSAPGKKKMSRRQAAAQYRDLNAMRRARMGTRG